MGDTGQTAAVEQTEVGSYFVANYPPFSLWTQAAVDTDARPALAQRPADTPLGLYGGPACRSADIGNDLSDLVFDLVHFTHRIVLVPETALGVHGNPVEPSNLLEEQHDLGSQLAEDSTARRPTIPTRDHRHGLQLYAGPEHDGHEEQADNHPLSRVDWEVEYRGVGQDCPHQNG